jgi:hypothetical protein
VLGDPLVYQGTWYRNGEKPGQKKVLGNVSTFVRYFRLKHVLGLLFVIVRVNASSSHAGMI